MQKNSKVIITCAVTGAIHTPSLSPHLPVTPQQIADQAVAAADAGAAILYLHARDPQTGCPTPDPDVFMQFLPTIKQRTDAIINITTGGGLNMAVEQRMAAALRAEPELCSLNMGSMNFGIHPMAWKDREWKYDWEEPYLLNTDDFIFKNTFRNIETALRELGEKRAPGLSLNAMTSATYTVLPTFWIAAWLNHRYLYKVFLAYWEVSALIRKTWRL